MASTRAYYVVCSYTIVHIFILCQSCIGCHGSLTTTSYEVQTASVGSTVTFSCRTDSNSSKIRWDYYSHRLMKRVQLFFGGEFKPSLSRRYEVHFSPTSGLSTLVIGQIEATDSGNYICFEGKSPLVNKSFNLMVEDTVVHHYCGSNSSSSNVVSRHLNLADDQNVSSYTLTHVSKDTPTTTADHSGRATQDHAATINCPGDNRNITAIIAMPIAIAVLLSVVILLLENKLKRRCRHTPESINRTDLNPVHSNSDIEYGRLTPIKAKNCQTVDSENVDTLPSCAIYDELKDGLAQPNSPESIVKTDLNLGLSYENNDYGRQTPIEAKECQTVDSENVDTLPSCVIYDELKDGLAQPNSLPTELDMNTSSSYCNLKPVDNDFKNAASMLPAHTGLGRTDAPMRSPVNRRSSI